MFRCSAAPCLSGFQIMRRHDLFSAAGAPAQPACTSVSVFRALKHCKFSEPPSPQILCNASPARVRPWNTPAVPHCPPGQPLRIYIDLLSAVAPAAPDCVMLLPFLCFFCHGQMSETFSRQISSVAHCASSVLNFSLFHLCAFFAFSVFSFVCSYVFLHLFRPLKRSSS